LSEVSATIRQLRLWNKRLAKRNPKAMECESLSHRLIVEILRTRLEELLSKALDNVQERAARQQA
jgi:hypothetical protein